jgi:PAS domain S-box-containing protein
VPDPAPAIERTCALDPVALSAQQARAFVQGVLEEAGHPEWVESAILAVSEVVTNAVLHAHTSVEVTARVDDDGLRVEVRDHNPTLPSQRSYDTPATTGRGMDLVAAVTSEFGVQALGPDGKIVWFSVGGSQAEQTADELLELWADDGWEDDAADGVTIVLQNMPATLWLAARQRHDALLRELRLYWAEHPRAGSEESLMLSDEARMLISLALDRAITAARDRGEAVAPLPADYPAPLPKVPARLDLEITVRPEQSRAFAVLQDVLDSAERLAVADLLLMRPGLPEIVALRDWACEQVIAQLGGTAPAPWGGAHDERFTVAVRDRAEPREISWDSSLVTDAPVGAVAADAANRIIAVSGPLAAELGWAAADLVGRRVVTLVPPRYREAHVAGFSRYLTTGEAHVIGVPLELPVLRADGSEVMCSLLIEQVDDGSAPVYVAWITPATGA